MRRTLTFFCEGDRLSGTLDEAPGTTGLLIVSGGNEIRIGAHRGMARLAADVAAAGHPVFRFDRRGIGDSEGQNSGFEASGPDLEAALAAFLREAPHVTRVVAFGNCDAASALALHKPDVDALVIANPWVVEPEGDLPPPAAIKAHYLGRLRDPKALFGLLTGAVNVRKLMSGMARLARPEVRSSLAEQVAAGLATTFAPITILLASGDGTAIAFADQWTKPAFAPVRARPDIVVEQVNTASHSFAAEADHAQLLAAILRQCAAKSA